MGFAVHRTPKVRNCNAPVIYKLMTQERVETMHRKRAKCIIIFSFRFDLSRLGQNQLWEKRFISNFWGAGQNPTLFYCDHSNETFLEVLFADFTGFLCFLPNNLWILPRVKVLKGQEMDIQHSLLPLLLLVVRTNISKEFITWPRGDTKFPFASVVYYINNKPFHSSNFLVWKARFIM